MYQFTVMFFNFIRCWGKLWSKPIFGAQSIYSEVYGVTYIYTYSYYILFIYKFSVPCPPHYFVPRKALVYRIHSTATDKQWSMAHSNTPPVIHWAPLTAGSSSLSGPYQQKIFFFIIRFYAIMHRTTIVQNKIISTICSLLFFWSG